MIILLYLFFLWEGRFHKTKSYEYLEFFRYCQSGLKTCMEKTVRKAICKDFQCKFSILPTDEILYPGSWYLYVKSIDLLNLNI